MPNKLIKEKSVGAVIYHETHGMEHGTMEHGIIEYLVLHYPPMHPDPNRARGQKTSKMGHWDYVKGHIDKRENDIATLKREIKEEIGLGEENYRVIAGFKKLLKYNFRSCQGLHFKEVIFYLIEARTREIKLSPEHDDYMWLVYEEALRLITFKGGKNILIKAHEYLISM